MNNITIAGTIGRDAEVRYMNNGEAVASFSVADSQGKDKPTIWWKCNLYGKRAESLAPYLLKGQKLTVGGSVTLREYTKDGETKQAQELRVSEVALQGSKEAEKPSKPASKPTSDDFADSIPF